MRTVCRLDRNLPTSASAVASLRPNCTPHTMLCANPVRLSVPTTAARPAARGALRVQATDKRSRSSLAEVAEFQRSPSDCGSTEVQVALLSSRVTSLTKHLQQNKKDYDTQRGLLQVRLHAPQCGDGCPSRVSRDGHGQWAGGCMTSISYGSTGGVGGTPRRRCVAFHRNPIWAWPIRPLFRASALGVTPHPRCGVQSHTLGAIRESRSSWWWDPVHGGTDEGSVVERRNPAGWDEFGWCGWALVACMSLAGRGS